MSEILKMEVLNSGGRHFIILLLLFVFFRLSGLTDRHLFIALIKTKKIITIFRKKKGICVRGAFFYSREKKKKMDISSFWMETERVNERAGE